jgi:hypothetical protein
MSTNKSHNDQLQTTDQTLVTKFHIDGLEENLLLNFIKFGSLSYSYSYL